jgi:hypothetical protein
MMRLTDRLVTTKEKHTSTYSRQGSKVREIQDPLDETEPGTRHRRYRIPPGD